MTLCYRNTFSLITQLVKKNRFEFSFQRKLKLTKNEIEIILYWPSAKTKASKYFLTVLAKNQNPLKLVSDTLDKTLYWPKCNLTLMILTDTNIISSLQCSKHQTIDYLEDLHPQFLNKNMGKGAN